MEDSYRQAVKENRMVSVQEATVRQILGCTTLALTTGWLCYKVQHRVQRLTHGYAIA